MFTLPFIKCCAPSMSPDGIMRCKEYADRHMEWGLWWAFECVEMYQHFLISMDKLFWWSMVVKTLRYANYYVRNGRN